MTSLSTYNRLTKVFETAMEIPFDNSSKIVLIGDCHKGDGSWADDFNHNRNLYYAAVKYYFSNGFTYFDLGDSDELWKNKKYSDITSIYTDTFCLLHKYYCAGRYYMIFGNHDIVKKDPEFVRTNMRRYYNGHTNCYEPMFENAVIHEGIILKDTDSQTKLFLVHGHQGDILSDTFWEVGRFLSRNIWRRLELFGYKDPTSAAKNYQERRKVERKITEWAEKNNQIVIAGHTHRPSCSPEPERLYFNVGSCVHPNCITCIEIVKSEITLVKWDIKTRQDRTLYIDREPISLPRKI